MTAAAEQFGPGPDPFTNCMGRLDELNALGADETERIERLEGQVRVLFGMLYCQGRGLSTLFECFGIDPFAACADLEADVSA